MRNKILLPIFYAIIAAVFYAVNMPLSKLLLNHIEPTLMASFLYFGAGIGTSILYLLKKDKQSSSKLSKSDLPYTVGMIVLDIIAPILLMIGLTAASSASASLLNNFEIAATSIIALIIFKELISARLWLGIALITISSVLLSVEDISSFTLSSGSLFILGATICWGLENNCTRQISNKNTYAIVILKGIFSGLGSFIVAMIIGEHLPHIQYVVCALLLGFVAYGLSIFFYIRAQKTLGAAKTSAYYAIAPFVGALLSYVLIKEPLSQYYLLALFVMVLGSVVVIADTLMLNHTHLHTHTITHTHDGSTHTHVITHEHSHNHLLKSEEHTHQHLSSVYHN